MKRMLKWHTKECGYFGFVFIFIMLCLLISISYSHDRSNVTPRSTDTCFNIWVAFDRALSSTKKNFFFQTQGAEAFLFQKKELKFCQQKLILSEVSYKKKHKNNKLKQNECDREISKVNYWILAKK